MSFLNYTPTIFIKYYRGKKINKKWLGSSRAKAIPIKCFVFHHPADPIVGKIKKKKKMEGKDNLIPF